MSATVEVVELRELARDLADNLLTGFPNARLGAAVATVTGADGLIAVTPTFSASYSGLFKTFFDVIDQDALAGRPVLVGATAGTARHSLVLDHALRPVFTYLRAVVVPTGVFAATEDFGGGESDQLGRRVARAATDLANLVVAESGSVAGFVPHATPQRRAGTAIDPDVTDFETMLADLGH